MHVHVIPLTTREQPVGLNPAALGQKMRWSLMMDGVLTLYHVEEEVGFGDGFNRSFSTRTHVHGGNLSLLDRLQLAHAKNPDRSAQGASFFSAMQNSLVGPAQGRKATVNVSRTPSTERPNMRTPSRTASYNSQDSSVL